MGDVKGTIPILARINAIAMVTKGADRALPSRVRCSKKIPKVLTNSTAVKQYEGSVCKDDSMVILRAVEVVVVVVVVDVDRDGFLKRCREFENDVVVVVVVVVGVG